MALPTPPNSDACILKLTGTLGIVLSSFVHDEINKINKKNVKYLFKLRVFNSCCKCTNFLG